MRDISVSKLCRRFAREGTFAEVEYTRLYASLLLGMQKPRRLAYSIPQSHGLDSQRTHELDLPVDVGFTQRNDISTAGCFRLCPTTVATRGLKEDVDRPWSGA